MRQGQCSQVAGNLFWGKRWVIEGQRAWEGRGSGWGQVAAGVAADIRPVSRARRSLLYIVRNRRLPFCAAHCHRRPGGSGSFVGLGGGRGNYQLCGGNKLGKMIYSSGPGRGIQPSIAGSPEMQRLCGDRNPRLRKITSGVFTSNWPYGSRGLSNEPSGHVGKRGGGKICWIPTWSIPDLHM